MNLLEETLRKAIEQGASDIFIIAGLPKTYKINGKQVRTDTPPLRPEDTQEMIKKIYVAAQRDSELFFGGKNDDDFSFSISKLGRFRVNVFRQRGSCAAVIRIIQFGLPAPEEFGIPERVLCFSKKKKGLVLVTGPAGSGKSTTLACIIDRINQN